jgi:hypothetical protein
MSPRVGTINRILFVQWNSQPDAADVRLVVDAMHEARRAAGPPLIMIGTVVRGATMPTWDGRGEIIRRTPTVERLCETIYGVLVGDDVGTVLLRGCVALASAMMRHPVILVASVQVAVERACARLRIDPAAVLAEAIARGLVDEG